MINLKNRAPATGLEAMSSIFFDAGTIGGYIACFVSAKYIAIGWWISAGAYVINQLEALKDDVKDYISFLIRFLLVIDPGIWAPM